METSDKLQIFLCSGAIKPNSKKLSYRIATYIAALGFAEIGRAEDLTKEKITESKQQKIVFINDCRSGCINLLTQGVDSDRFLSFDVSSFSTVENFDIESYIRKEMFPTLEKKWNLFTTFAVSV